MAKIAVDIALILPEEIMDLVIKLNERFEGFSIFNKKNNLPHITLAMGVINESDIKKVNGKLKDICLKFNPLNLEITEVYHIIKPNDKKSFSFRIKMGDELKNLHTIIMKELLPIFTYDVSEDMFNQDDKVSPISMQWVENYGKNHKDPENYNPHISLHCNKYVVFNDVPIKFKASKVALCHLGSHCTCRRILGQVVLENYKSLDI